MLCFLGLVTLLVIVAPPCIRMTIGPWSSTYCWWQIFFNQCLSVSLMLVICVNYLARYFYVVVYKTATICNDDFLSFFISVEILMMGFAFALLHSMSPGKFALNYYVCQGKNPVVDAIGIFIHFMTILYTEWQFVINHNRHFQLTLKLNLIFPYRGKKIYCDCIIRCCYFNNFYPHQLQDLPGQKETGKEAEISNIGVPSNCASSLSTATTVFENHSKQSHLNFD